MQPEAKNGPSTTLPERASGPGSPRGERWRLGPLRFGPWRLLRWALSAGVLALVLAWGAGRMLHGSNRWLTLASLLPSPVVAGVLLAAAAVALWRRWFLAALGWAILAGAPLAFIIGPENHFTAPPPLTTSDPVRIVHWNVMEGTLGWDGVTEALAATGADVCVLSEYPLGDPDLIPRLAQRLYGDEASHWYQDELAVVARGTLEDVNWWVRQPFMKVHAHIWRHRGHELLLLEAEVVSNPFLDRRAVVAYIRYCLELTPVDVLVGDLNTPRYQPDLANLPEGYAHAYERGGSGWGYTWPAFLPVVAIDHCIIGPRVASPRYELRSSPHSDHRMQILTFELLPP